MSLSIPEVYVIVEAGVVTAVHSTHDMDVVTIYTDMEDCDEDLLEHARKLSRCA